MSTPQDASNRKKQKVRAARKLALWRKKQEPKADAGADATSSKSAKK